MKANNRAKLSFVNDEKLTDAFANHREKMRYLMRKYGNEIGKEEARN